MVCVPCAGRGVTPCVSRGGHHGGQANGDDGRQRGGCLGRPPDQRGHRDLPDHPVVEHGRVGGRVVGEGPEEHLGHGPQRDGDAVRGRRGRRGPRRAAGRRPDDDVHRVAGPPPHDPQHVQDRGRAHRDVHARERAHARDPRALDLRRPLRRDGGPADRLRPARLRVRPGGARLRGHRAARLDALADPVPALLRRVPHLARGREGRGAHRRRSPADDHRGPRRGAPLARALARPAVPARHRPEPRRVLPGARGDQQLLRRRRRPRAGGDGPLREDHRARLPAVRVPRPPPGGARRRRDGLGLRDGPRDHRRARRAGREGRPREGPALPALRSRRLHDLAAAVGAADRRPRPHQGAGLARRAALPWTS